MKPSGATHKSPDGRYYKRVGNFWYVFGDGWWVVSGNPAKADKFKEIK